MRLPVTVEGEPHTWPEVKSKKHLEPVLVFPTAEKAMRLAMLRSEVLDFSKYDSHTCQLPMMLWTPRPQFTNWQYHTQISIEFQPAVIRPLSQLTNWQRRTSFSAWPWYFSPPKRRPVLAFLKTMSLVSL